MSSVTKTQQAVVDIIEAAEFISEDSLDSALRFVDAVQETLGFIAKSPEIGTLCSFSAREATGMRVWQVKGFSNYLLFYRSVNNTIELVRLIHGARDIHTILSD